MRDLDIEILGGIDSVFLVRGTTENIAKSSLKMLERSAERGGYALDSGNSIPSYIPDENHFAMMSTLNM